MQECDERHEQRRKERQEVGSKPVADSGDGTVRRRSRQDTSPRRAARDEQAEQEDQDKRERRLGVVAKHREIFQVEVREPQQQGSGNGQQGSHSEPEHGVNARNGHAEECGKQRPERTPGHAEQAPGESDGQHQVAPRALLIHVFSAKGRIGRDRGA